MKVEIEHLVSRAQLFINEERLKEAEVLLLQASSINANHHDVLLQMASLYNHRNEPDQALDYLKKSLEKTTANNETYIIMGESYMIKKNFKKAYDCFEKAIVHSPQNPAGYLEIGKCCYFQGTYEKALSFFERAIKLGADNTELYNVMGESYEALGNLEKGLEYYRRAMAIWDGSPKAVFNYLGSMLAFEEGKAILNFMKSIHKTKRLTDDQEQAAFIFELLVEYLNDDTKKTEELLKQIKHSKINKKNQYTTIPLIKCYQCIKDVITFRAKHTMLYEDKRNKTNPQPIYLIGDEQVLAQANMLIFIEKDKFICQTNMIMGLTMHCFNPEAHDKNKKRFKLFWDKVPDNAHIVLMCGSNDCEEDNILKRFGQQNTTSWTDIAQEIAQIVDNYTRHISLMAKTRNIKVTFYGIPSSHINQTNNTDENIALIKQVTKEFNAQLSKKAELYQCNFINVYKITADKDDNAITKYYLNESTMRPDVFLGLSQIISI